MTSSIIFTLLRALETKKLYYVLSRHRDDSIMITVTDVGKRVEIDVFEDNHIEYSIFSGTEDVVSDLPDLCRTLGITL